jgi:hypothetical protein
MSGDQLALVIMSALHEECKKSYWAGREHCDREYDETMCKGLSCHGYTSGQCALQRNIDTLLKAYARTVRPFSNEQEGRYER